MWLHSSTFMERRVSTPESATRTAAVADPISSPGQRASSSRKQKILSEAMGLVRKPQRTLPLLTRVVGDGLGTRINSTSLYSYVTTHVPTERALPRVVGWILRAQKSDGGIPAYYSLLTGYSNSYPEVTGYIVPTLYDFSQLTNNSEARHSAERATRWLLSLQMQNGAFSGGLEHAALAPSVFNTGQILQGLVRAYRETNDADILMAANGAGNWLAEIQQADGSWSGHGAYQGVAHTYYSMVGWALALLAEVSKTGSHARAAEKNLDWVLPYMQPNGWIDGINLQGYPTFLHFIAYVIQGVLECGILRRNRDAVNAAERSAWKLLRKFELKKHLLGSYAGSFESGASFSCLTGNAQMSCVWLRLAEVTGDLRFFNAALKMNEMLKERLPAYGQNAGGVAGSHPIWGAYQPMRYISWGCKFFADALMLELRMKRSLGASPCAS
jgi:nitrogen fixation protein FixH